MSVITFAPLSQIAVHLPHVREHRRFLLRNHLAKPTSFQASWPSPNQLAPKPLTSSNARAKSLSVTRRVPEAIGDQTILAATTPSAIDEVERVAAHAALRAEKAPARS